MTCDRCIDIHKAQREGKTQRECGCSCHHYTFYTGTGTNTFTLTGATTGNTAITGGTPLFTTDSTGNDVF